MRQIMTGGCDAGRHRQCRSFAPVCDMNGGNEAVSLSLACVDEPPAILSIAQRSSERGNLELEVSFADVRIGPDPSQQLGLGDPLTGPFKQGHEQVEGAASYADGIAGFQQQSLAGKNLEVVERKNTIDRGSELFSHFDLD